MTDRDKKSTSYRLTPEVLRLIAKLAKKWGITRAQVIEVSVREKAEREATQ